MIYDETTATIDTPGGPGKFIEYDGATNTVLVELDNQYLVFYPGSACYLGGTR